MKSNRNSGFTLAEVLVASTISAFIALVGVGALKAVTDGAQIVRHASETVGEVRFAARMLARDLANLYFDPNPRNMKFVGASQESAMGGPPYLTFYMVGRTQARADQPEGDVYEVEYMLGRRQEDEAVVDIEDPSMILFRRLWPNPDEERLPGGVLTVVAEDISIFQIRFFDGEQWADEWPEEMETMPELLEVSLGTVPEDLGDPILETFVVNCTRLKGRSSASASDEEESEGGARAEEPQDEQPSGEQGAGGSVRAR